MTDNTEVNDLPPGDNSRVKKTANPGMEFYIRIPVQNISSPDQITAFVRYKGARSDTPLFMGVYGALLHRCTHLLKEGAAIIPEFRLSVPTPSNEHLDRLYNDLLAAGVKLDKECASAPTVDPHQPGAKLDTGKVRFGLIMEDFHRALYAIAQVATFGAEKYTPHGWVSVPNGIDRYTDAMYRHLNADAGGAWRDPESKLPHLAHAAWNALAVLELELRLEEAQQAAITTLSHLTQVTPPAQQA